MFNVSDINHTLFYKKKVEMQPRSQTYLKSVDKIVLKLVFNQ